MEFVDSERFLAKVDVSGVRRVVNVALVLRGTDGAGVGDWVLLHVGFAMSHIDGRIGQMKAEVGNSDSTIDREKLQERLPGRLDH